MGTSWIKRHRHETDERLATDKKAYKAWKAKFLNARGKVSEVKIRDWYRAYQANAYPHWPTSKAYFAEQEALED